MSDQIWCEKNPEKYTAQKKRAVEAQRLWREQNPDKNAARRKRETELRHLKAVAVDPEFRCRKDRQRWAEQNQDKIKESKRKYQREYARRVRAKDPDYFRREYTKLKANPVKYAETQERIRVWRKAHPKKRTAQLRKYQREWQHVARMKNPESYHERDRRQYIKMKADPVKYAKTLARNRLQKKEHPEKAADHNARRRARAANVEHESVERLVVADRDGWKCRYCDVSLTKKTLTLDHVRPISKGGPHTYANIVAACQSCNFSKHDRGAPSRKTA